MYLKKLLVISLCLYTIIYAGENNFKRLYWMPHINGGTLVDEDDEKISGRWSYGFFYGICCQLSSKLAISLLRDQFLKVQHEDGCIVDAYKAVGWSSTLRYSPDKFKQYVFSRKIQGYIQCGGWYAYAIKESVLIERGVLCALEAIRDPRDAWCCFCEGGGLIGGIGMYYEHFSGILFDISGKALIGFPVFAHTSATTSMKSTFMITLTARVPLW